MAIRGADGSIILTTEVDTRGLKKGMTSMKSGVSSLTSAFGKLGAAIGVAFSVRALISFSNEASKMASNTEASVQRLIDIYGSASQAVGDFIDANANAIGMSRAAATSMAATYGNLLSVWADQQTNAQLTTSLLNQTAVVASKTGRTTEDVAERIRSGLLGNTEAIEDLGINVNIKTIEITEAFKRIADGRSWAQLNAYEQAQVRTLAILEQSTTKYGNTVANTTAFTRQQYQAAWEDFKNTWGVVINRILMPILKVLTKVFQYATMALQAIFGISGKTINVDTSGFSEQEQAIGGAVSNQEALAGAVGSAVDNQNDLTDAVKGTAKEQKKLLAGFDDLQIISEKTSDASSAIDGANASGGASGGGAGGGIGAGDLQLSETEGIAPVDTSQYENLRQILQGISNLFMSGFWQGFQNADFSSVETSIDNIKTTLTGIATNPEVQSSLSNAISSYISSLGIVTGSVASIGTTTATNLLGGFSQYLTTNKPFIQTSIASIFDASASMATSVGNLWAAFANIFSAHAGQNGQALTANIIGIFSNAALGIVTLARKIGADFMNFLTQPIVQNQEGLKTVLDSLLGVFAGLTGGIKTLVDTLVQGVLTLYDEKISPFIQLLTDTVTEWVNKFVEAYHAYIKPVLEEFAIKFQEVVEQYLAPMFEKIFEFIGKVIDLITPLWENILKPLVSWLIDVFANTFSEVFGRIGDIVMSAVQLVSGLISGIMDVLGGVIDFLVGIFTKDWERVWQGLVGIFKGIINIIISIFEGMINLVINALNLFVSALDIVVGAVGSIVGQEWNIPKIPTVSIPRLAQGAVIPPNREFLAVLGDQKSGTNIETPLDTMVQAFQMALDSRGGAGGSKEIILEVNGREFGRAVVDLGGQENRRIGTRLVIA